MNEEEIDREIRSTLKDIFDYLGVASLDDTHAIGRDSESLANNATLRTFMERLIKKVTQS